LTISRDAVQIEKNRLINEKPQEPDPKNSEKPLDQATKWQKTGLLSKKSVLVFLAFSFFLTTPAQAHAGFFSDFFTGLFSVKAETISDLEKDEPNSQNSLFLQADTNPDPNPTKNDSSITIVDGNALLPESGMSDVRDQSGIKILDKNTDLISLYVVHKGDTLSEIAKMFGVSAKTILWANDLASAKSIKVGQTLVILPVSGIQHTVVKGETIASISKKYDADIQEFMDFNDFEKGQILKVGMNVIVPGGEMQLEEPSAPVTPKNTSIYVSSPTRAGSYIRPVVGGRRSQGIHGKNGIDIGSLPVGTPVFAAADGEVILSKYSASNPWFGGYGNYIIIQHPNGAQTLYAHLSGNKVSRGDKVAQGQTIGYSGNTGRSTGPHLHFEIRGDIRNPF
jgi:murein DD-endopeptidase MepM/ murein hydrolase activator NlpD